MPKPLRSVVAVRVAHHASVRQDAGRVHHAIYLMPERSIVAMMSERSIAAMMSERPIAATIAERSGEQQPAFR